LFRLEEAYSTQDKQTPMANSAVDASLPQKSSALHAEARQVGRIKGAPFDTGIARDAEDAIVLAVQETSVPG
jgi:hypothetical protein